MSDYFPLWVTIPIAICLWIGAMVFVIEFIKFARDTWREWND